jgi:hypothetical protein
MPFSYYRRLSAAQKRTYDASDRIHRIQLPDPDALREGIVALVEALADDERHRVQSICQDLADRMLRSLRVSPVRLSVLAVRPSNTKGELHGLYDPTKPNVAPTISLWMRTAQRQQVVAFRTFFRTFLHEICHHLDYELLRLADSFHTQGFYKRESSLFHQLIAAEPGRQAEG